jgi:hypothetical protein
MDEAAVVEGVKGRKNLVWRAEEFERWVKGKSALNLTLTEHGIGKSDRDTGWRKVNERLSLLTIPLKV